MIFDPFPVFLPAEYRVKFATEAWERREAAALRRQVFCEEQGIFAGDDRDEIDDVAIPIVAISSFGVALARGRRHRAHPRGRARRLVGLAARGRRGLSPHRRARLRADPPCGVARRMPAAASASSRMCRARTRCCSGACIGARSTRSSSTAGRTISCRPISLTIRRSPTPRPASCHCRRRPPDARFASRSAELAATLRASRGLAAKRDIAAVAARLGVSAPVRRSGRRRLRRDSGRRRLPAARDRRLHERVRRGRSVVRRLVRRHGERLRRRRDGRAADRGGRCGLGGERRRCGRRCSPACARRRRPSACRSSAATPIRAPTAASSRSRSSAARRRLLTSFDAQPGDRLVAAIDLRGRYREPFSNWEAATDAPPARLRGDLELLPANRRSRPGRAPPRTSRQGGIIGTAMMLAECSGVGATIDVTRVPRPDGVALERWLQTFPSYGYLLAVPPANVAAVLGALRGARHCGGRDRASHARTAGSPSPRACATETIWDFAREPLIGCRTRSEAFA